MEETFEKYLQGRGENVSKSRIICKVGEIVKHKGKKYFVSQVVSQGIAARILKPKGNTKGRTIPEEKACIVGNRMDFDGSQLFRTNIYIGTRWK